VSITNLAGTGFQAGATVKLSRTGGAAIAATNVQVTATKISCSLNLAGKTAGMYSIVVTNPDGKSTTLQNGFSVTASSGSSTTAPAIVKFPGQSSLPTDPDGDLLYEDTNGNRIVDINDVMIFAINMNWIKGNQPLRYFDYNKDGRIDYRDIMTLAWKLR
jgi:PKD repeat protein